MYMLPTLPLFKNNFGRIYYILCLLLTTCDFNMLEHPITTMRCSSTMIHGHELAIWEKLMFSLQVLYAWHAPLLVRRWSSSFLFSRSDRRNGTNLSRFDRFYVSGKFLSSSGTIHIMPGTPFHIMLQLFFPNRIKNFNIDLIWRFRKIWCYIIAFHWKWVNYCLK